MNRREIMTGREYRMEIWDNPDGTVEGVYKGISVKHNSEINLRAYVNWLAYHGV